MECTKNDGRTEYCVGTKTAVFARPWQPHDSLPITAAWRPGRHIRKTRRAWNEDSEGWSGFLCNGPQNRGETTVEGPVTVCGQHLSAVKRMIVVNDDVNEMIIFWGQYYDWWILMDGVISFNVGTSYWGGLSQIQGSLCTGQLFEGNEICISLWSLFCVCGKTSGWLTMTKIVLKFWFTMGLPWVITFNRLPWSSSWLILLYDFGGLPWVYHDYVGSIEPETAMGKGRIWSLQGCCREHVWATLL